MFVTESQLNANLQVVQVVVIHRTCEFWIACGLLVLPEISKLGRDAYGSHAASFRRVSPVIVELTRHRCWIRL